VSTPDENTQSGVDDVERRIREADELLRAVIAEDLDDPERIAEVLHMVERKEGAARRAANNERRCRPRWLRWLGSCLLG
jgi:hypothetical protein